MIFIKNYLKNHAARIVITAFAIISSVIFNFSRFTPLDFRFKNDDEILLSETSHCIYDQYDIFDYLPICVKKIPEKFYIPKVKGKVKHKIISFYKKSNEIKLKIKLDSDGMITFPSYYFKGWEAYVNGKKVKINTEKDSCLIQLKIEKGIHTVSLQFKEKGIRFFSNIVSLGTLTYLIFTGFNHYLNVFLIKIKRIILPKT